MDTAEADYKNLVPLFLTLTLQNCKTAVPEMAQTLDKIFGGWNRLWMNRELKTQVRGWFRALELTYDGEKTISNYRYKKNKIYYDKKNLKPGDANPNYDTFHPHIHAIVLVDRSYFQDGYIKTEEWVQLWRSAMRLDYDPICDIRKIQNSKGKRKGIAEVSKYTVKDAEITAGDNATTDRLVNVLNKTLKGRRLYAFGGLLKQIQAKFTATAPDEGDLVKTSGETIRADVATVIEIYHWNFGVHQYERMEEKPKETAAALVEKLYQNS
jgi:hypothetical protein